MNEEEILELSESEIVVVREEKDSPTVKAMKKLRNSFIDDLMNMIQISIPLNILQAEEIADYIVGVAYTTKYRVEREYEIMFEDAKQSLNTKKGD